MLVKNFCGLNHISVSVRSKSRSNRTTNSNAATICKDLIKIAATVIVAQCSGKQAAHECTGITLQNSECYTTRFFCNLKILEGQRKQQISMLSACLSMCWHSNKWKSTLTKKNKMRIIFHKYNCMHGEVNLYIMMFCQWTCGTWTFTFLRHSMFSQLQ